MSHSQRMKPTGLKGYNFKHIKKQPKMTIISSLEVLPLTLVGLVKVSIYDNYLRPTPKKMKKKRH